ncbi:hypothetical protein [Prochlorococcus sp. MIT 1300]|uniref:hypothetical protein n=1 Tax=Prochlorococcus sp. MIT 1300 TaxID=3096218 RepID=UPI002A764DF4|nr:hypothetical protein [Prochlorococcus sp. MIT 1300]
MKKVFPLIIALSLGIEPVLAWGWGDCPHSQKGPNQETSNEKVEKNKSSKKD